MRRLDLVVGPNGAGKSTFVELTLVPSLPAGLPFVNADEIAKVRWPEDPSGHAYEAAATAAATRRTLIGTGQSFVAETVFSHSSKLDLVHEAQSAGYAVHMHVLLVPEDLAVLRVARRVDAGGHEVPEIKIRERYERLWPLVRSAMTSAESATVYDNSSGQGPRIVLRLAGGVQVGAIDLPGWTPAVLSSGWTG